MRKNFLLLTLFVLVILFNTLPVYGAIPIETLSSSFPTSYQEVDYVLPYPGILPDHSLFFLKKWRDNVLLFLTRDPLRKSEIYLLLADKKVGMGQRLWEKGKLDLSIETVKQAEENLLQATAIIIGLKETDRLPEGFADKVELAAKKHRETINRLTTSPDAKEYQNQLQETLEINQQAIEQLSIVK